MFYSVVRCINNNKSQVIEGELRCRELCEFLEKHKADKSVWLAEDATAIVPKIQYDPTTNQLVGILLPMNAKGLPIPFRYLLHSITQRNAIIFVSQRLFSNKNICVK